MHKKTCLVPANDNRVPSWFETIEHEDDALDLAIGAAMDAEIIGPPVQVRGAQLRPGLRPR